MLIVRMLDAIQGNYLIRLTITILVWLAICIAAVYWFSFVTNLRQSQEHRQFLCLHVRAYHRPVLRSWFIVRGLAQGLWHCFAEGFFFIRVLFLSAQASVRLVLLLHLFSVKHLEHLLTST